MAIMQRFRGNPEEKKYVLYNNFSGGINTTDIDEVVLTSQFRVLENVELAQRGAIQNRKGFQYYKPLNDLLSPITLNFDHIYLLTPLEDDQNVLELISKSESLEKFLEENPYAFEIMMLAVGARTESNLQVHVLKIARDENEPTVTKSAYVHTLGYQYDRPKRITDIEFVNFNNRLYIALGQLSSKLEGFLEVYIDDDGNPRFKRMNSTQGFYTPNAYEIANIGFNNLAASPLNAIEPSYTSVESIRTFWLTKVINKEDSFSSENLTTPIYKIPNNTDFILNVLVTGALSPEDLNIDIYTQDLEGGKVFVKPEGRDKIVESKKDGDLLRYRIAVNIEQTKETFIDVNKKQFANPEITETFESVTDMISAFTTRANHYIVDSSGKYAEVKIPTSSTYGYMTPTLSGKTVYGGKIWYKYVNRNEGALYWSSMPDNPNYRGTDTSLPPASGFSEGFAMRIGTNINNYEYYRLDITEDEIIPSMRLDNALVLTPTIANYPNLEGVWRPVLEGSGTVKSVTRFVKITSSGPVYENISGTTYSNLDNEVRPEPELLGLYFITESNKYYKWIGTYDGASTDFEEYDTSQEDIVEFSFVNTFDIGQDLDLQPIKPINTTNVKMIEHGGRLLIYDKNTMWFSDLYNFNYFPNNNYVILPLRSDDEIMKIAYFRGSYIILTRFSLYRMSGTFGTEEFEVVLINNAIGCTSADSVRNVNNTLVFLTNDGLYLLKQNYFMEGLENVEKIDIQTQGIYPIDRNVESIIYKEQLLFFVKDKNDEYVKTIKQYYNLPIAKNMFPVSVDRYRTGLQGVSKLGTNLVAYKDRKFYIYDRGYSDFMPEDVEEEDRENYFYKVTIITPKYNLGYPTHDKKYKNLYINTRTEKISPLSVTVYVDGYEYINPSQFQATLNKEREIVYTQITNNNIEMRHAALGMNPSDDFVEYYVQYDEYGQIIGMDTEVFEDILKPVYNVNDFEIGVDKLGVQEMQTHKLVISGKGKTVSFKIEHLVDEMIVIHNLGILHKLGKVKEG